ncbi:MAG: gluconate 2-dehydrogenase subunit 3 family protein [Bacteroidota bacterium]
MYQTPDGPAPGSSTDRAPFVGREISRRDALRIFALAAAGAAAGTTVVGCQSAGEEHAGHMTSTAQEQQPPIDAEPQFFTAAEYATVAMLADYILPADERGPSASEAGVPSFIDWVMIDELLGDPEERQTAMREGLAWLDAETESGAFTAATDEQRRAVLDRIAYPENAAEADQPGVEFFNRFRDYTATGYWSSPAGVEDIGYIGNVPHQWTGCPSEVLRHVGLEA